MLCAWSRPIGFPIEVIGGREEARLIYIGAAHALPIVKHKRLVVDIGGGSTEFIIGKKFDPLAVESLFMGCVSYTLRFFPDGKVDKRRFAEAEVSAGPRRSDRRGLRALLPICSNPTDSMPAESTEPAALPAKVCPSCADFSFAPVRRQI